MSKNQLVLAASVFAFLTAFNVESHGFNIGNFGKILENVTEGSKSQGKPGPASNLNSGSIASSSNSGELDYSSGSIINFLCRREADDGEWKPDASIVGLKAAVAEDFGKSPQDTQNIIYKNRTNGRKWAQKLAFYKDGFNAAEVKRLFSNFLNDGLRRLEIAGKIKHAITHDDLEEAEQNDARFAYALILAHFNKFHSKQGYQETILNEAYQNDSLGAVYVVGHRLYYGVDGVRQNVKKAASILTTTDGWKNQEEDEWKNLMDLWYVVAVDPRNPFHERNRQFAAEAARVKADMEKEIARNSGSALRSNTEKLVNLQMEAAVLLSQAFGYAREQAELTQKYKDLLNNTDESQQVIAKKVRVSAEAAALAKRMIGKTTKELDPAGKAKLQEARGKNRYIVAQLGKTTMSFFGNFGSLSDMVALAPALDDSLKTSCGLHHSMTDYAAKKQIPVNNKKIDTQKTDMSAFNQ